MHNWTTGPFPLNSVSYLNLKLHVYHIYMRLVYAVLPLSPPPSLISTWMRNVLVELI